MKRAKEKLGTDDIGIILEKYDGRAFGFASKNFYAEFLAAVHIAKNYEKYFSDLQFEQPSKHKIFEVPDYITLDALSRKFGIEKQTLAQLNPSLRQPILKSARRIPKGFRLRLPFEADVDYQTLYAQVPAADKHTAQVVDKYYRVEPGDNLSSIARQFGTTVAALMELNDITNPRLLRVGQLLELPESARPTLVADRSSEKAQESQGGGMKTIAQPAATLQPIAIDSLGQLLAMARNQAGNLDLPYGPQLPAVVDASTWEFVVDFDEPLKDEIIIQPEETIGHLAEWLNVTTQRLRYLNDLNFGESLQIGQRFKVDFSRTSPAEFHRKRLEFHRSLQEDFFSNYRIEGTTSYSIKHGDSIWDLCNRVLVVPYWLLARYNKNIDLNRLQPGQQITVPIVIPVQESAMVNQDAS